MFHTSEESKLARGGNPKVHNLTSNHAGVPQHLPQQKYISILEDLWVYCCKSIFLLHILLTVRLQQTMLEIKHTLKLCCNQGTLSLFVYSEVILSMSCIAQIKVSQTARVWPATTKRWLLLQQAMRLMAMTNMIRIFSWL